MRQLSMYEAISIGRSDLFLQNDIINYNDRTTNILEIVFEYSIDDKSAMEWGLGR